MRPEHPCPCANYDIRPGEWLVITPHRMMHLKCVFRLDETASVEAHEIAGEVVVAAGPVETLYPATVPVVTVREFRTWARDQSFTPEHLGFPTGAQT